MNEKQHSYVGGGGGGVTRSTITNHGTITNFFKYSVNTFFLVMKSYTYR